MDKGRGETVPPNPRAMDIRLADPADAGQIGAIYAPVVLNTHISFEEHVPSAEEMAQRISACLRRYPWLVAVDGETIAGYAYGSTHRSRPGYRWSVESSVYIHERARRGGVARALYQRLFQMLTAQGFHAVYAGIALPNDASIALHRSMGFANIGVFREVGYKLGKWVDTSWWQLRLTDAHADGQPAEPITPRDLDERR